MNAVKKSDKELQIVWGVVYAPNVPDAHDDFMEPEEVMKMAYAFLKNERLKYIDVEHDNKQRGCYVVESFIARKGDPDFPEGAWVLGVHIPDQKTWSMVKSGELNGFSFQALVEKEEGYLEYDSPCEVRGTTSLNEEHKHDFVAFYGPDGEFLGGFTDPVVDGSGEPHYHLIKRGTLTEEEAGHAHRFDAVTEVVKRNAGP